MATWLGGGVSAVMDAFTKVSAQADATSRTIVTKAAALVEKTAKGNFQGAHRRGQPHVGPMQPNIVTGNLRRSITHTRVARSGPFTWSTEVGPTAIYGRRVELGGTFGNNTTRPFPYFGPAVDATQSQIAELAAAEWATFLRL